MKKIILKRKNRIIENKDSFDPVKEMEIDESHLEIEAKHQSALMAKIIQNYKKSLIVKGEMELELKIYEDRLSENIRDHPEDWGLDLDNKKDKRITDTAMARLFTRDSKWREIYRNLNNAKANVEEWEWMLKAGEQRNHNIKRLYNMWESGYAGDPMIKKKMQYNTEDID